MRAATSANAARAVVRVRVAIRIPASSSRYAGASEVVSSWKRLKVDGWDADSVSNPLSIKKCESNRSSVVDECYGPQPGRAAQRGPSRSKAPECLRVDGISPK